MFFYSAILVSLLVGATCSFADDQQSLTDNGNSPSSLLPEGSAYAVCGSYRYILASDTPKWGCCGEDLYNYNTENCTTQGIAPQRTTEVQSEVPAVEGILVFCSGIRFWVDPFALSTTRCCGISMCPAVYDDPAAMLAQTVPVVMGH